MYSPTKKKCSKCGLYKSIHEFRKYKHSTGGRGWLCTMCNRESARAYYNLHKKPYIDRASKWRKENPDKYKQSSKKCKIKNKDKYSLRAWIYGIINKDRIKKRRAEWLIQYKEKALANTQRWRKKNPEKSREWKKRHPEMVAVHTQNRKAKTKGNGGTFTAKEWERLCHHYGNKCLCCGKSNLKLTVDHVIPVSLGGSNSIDNIQPLCRSCNSRKSTRHVDYRSAASSGINTMPEKN